MKRGKEVFSLCCKTNLHHINFFSRREIKGSSLRKAEVVSVKEGGQMRMKGAGSNTARLN